MGIIINCQHSTEEQTCFVIKKIWKYVYTSIFKKKRTKDLVINIKF